MFEQPWDAEGISNPSSLKIVRRGGWWKIIPQGEGRFRKVRAFRGLDAILIDEGGCRTKFSSGPSGAVRQVTVESPILGFIDINQGMVEDVDYVIIKATANRMEVR